MKNTFIDKITSTVKVLVEGKNVNNYIKRLIKDKIDIISLNYLDYSRVEIIIKYSDYLKLKDSRSIYKLKIKEKYGKLKFREKIRKNYILFLSLIMGILFIVYLSKVIFSIEIIHINSDVVSLVEKELKKYDIVKYKMKKKYEEIEKIEDKILEDNKNKLEWIEIEEVGTKYIVRIEERKIKENNNDSKFQDVVMGKSGILKKIVATSGEKIKEINTFVSKGDIVISGMITKPNGEIIYTSANGSIYATVWYTIDVEYPYHYKEEILTGKKREVFYIHFFNKKFSLFPFKKFNSFQIEPDIIMYNKILPISFVKEKQYEVNVIDEIYTEEQVIDKAIVLSEDRLLASNPKIESIDEVSIISKEDFGSKIRIKLFLSVNEEVSELREINSEEIVGNDEGT